ncbi:MAG: hypothetical protein LC769_00330 [Chloroflexi bacterium]|nr:hypothetical protein [Chloroflexota bacterium]
MHDDPTASSSQEARIIDAWKDIDGLQPSRWATAGQEERMVALQQAEDEAAHIQGRHPLPVVIDYQAGAVDYGYYDGHAINIGKYSLDNDAVPEIANTLAHEGRHAYQDYAITYPGLHDSDEEVRAWEENMRPRNYVMFEDDPEGYYAQPVEADAWSFGDRIMSGVYTG